MILRRPKTLRSRARRAVAVGVLAVSALGGAAGAQALTGQHRTVAHPNFVCAGIGRIGACIGPPTTN